MAVSTPRPLDPTQKLAAAIGAADDLEQKGDTQAALEGYLKVVKDYPDIGAASGKSRMEMLTGQLRDRQSTLTPEQFDSLKEHDRKSRGSGRSFRATYFWGSSNSSKTLARHF